VWETVADAARRDVLASLAALDSGQDADFDRLTRLAARVFDVPWAIVSLVDLERQWFKSKVGLTERETPVRQAFCAYTLAQPTPSTMVVGDARADPRFAANLLVTGPPYVRFYAGVAITVRGEKIGTLAVLGPEPRHGVSQGELDQLIDLAQVAASLFDLKDESHVRARTAAELLREEWRHALTLEAGKVGSWVWDLRSDEVVTNEMLRHMHGLDGEAVMHMEDVFGAIHPDDLNTVRGAFEGAFEDGRDYVAEYRIAGTGRWIMSRGRVYQRDASGNPLVIMGVDIDMTDERESARRTRLLLRELNHRVKNTLAMIQSLARQTLKQSPDPQRFIEAFSGRLRTLSDAHVLLSDRDWTGIGLVELVNAQVSPYVADPAHQLVLEGEDMQLPPDHALGLGLILNELASNAANYGALSMPGGQIEVSWNRESSADGDDQVTLVWKERGGPPVSVRRKGLGSRLIERSLDKVLDSEVSLRFPVDGVEAHITFPLADPA
jgi:PAS domain S-box-containing protein